MNSKLVTLLLATALTTNLVACDSKDKKDNAGNNKKTVLIVDKESQTAKVPVETAKKDSDAKAEDAAGPVIATDEVETRDASAEEIALAGEQLVSLANFPLANQIFDMALKKDAKNQRAIFYKNVIRPFLALRGAAERLRPAFADRGQGKGYNAFMEQAPISPLRDFVTQTGRPEIKDEKSAQDFLVELRESFITTYRWMKKNTDTNLTLNMNPDVFKNIIEERQKEEACFTRDTGDSLELVCDKNASKDLLLVKINAADMLVLQQMYAGFGLYFTMYTSYSVEGLETLAKAIEAAGEISQMDAWKMVAGTEKLGTLRKDHSLGFIGEVGSDLKSAVNWAMKYQEGSCNPDLRARKGHLVQFSICITPEFYSSMQGIDMMLSGPYVAHHEVGDRDVALLTDYSVIWKNPPQDLKKTIAPTGFTKCGITGYQDKTLGGVFPQGNADETIAPCE